eukprot:m51a1_g11739 putative  U3 small nucleolar RNA-associated protein (1240) ;mRNA; f:143003-149227
MSSRAKSSKSRGKKELPAAPEVSDADEDELVAYDEAEEAAEDEDQEVPAPQKRPRAVRDPDEEEERLVEELFPVLDASIAQPLTKRRREAELEAAQPPKAPAWVDDDVVSGSAVDVTAKGRRSLKRATDETEVAAAEYERRLRERHADLRKQTADWAKLPSERDRERDAEELLQTDADLVEAGSLLRSDRLGVKRQTDLNDERRNKGTVVSLQFHPNGQAAFVASSKGVVSLFHVDGEKNAHMQTIAVPRTTLTDACFVADGSQMVITGRNRSFWVYDVASNNISRIDGVSGRSDRLYQRIRVSPDGEYIALSNGESDAVILNARSKHWMHTFHCNSPLVSLSFSPDSKTLYTAQESGEVCLWDMKMLRCSHVFEDEGCVHATAIDVGGKYVAVGSNSGVVNVYKAPDVAGSARPKPLSSVMSLVTPVSCVRFNHNSQLLCMASQDKNDALRVAHLPSGKVYTNWPTQRTPLGNVSAVAFSPHSGFVAIANARGNALLYRLLHYTSSGAGQCVTDKARVQVLLGGEGSGLALWTPSTQALDRFLPSVRPAGASAASTGWVYYASGNALRRFHLALRDDEELVAQQDAVRHPVADEARSRVLWAAAGAAEEQADVVWECDPATPARCRETARNHSLALPEEQRGTRVLYAWLWRSRVLVVTRSRAGEVAPTLYRNAYDVAAPGGLARADEFLRSDPAPHSETQPAAYDGEGRYYWLRAGREVMRDREALPVASDLLSVAVDPVGGQLLWLSGDSVNAALLSDLGRSSRLSFFPSRYTSMTLVPLCGPKCGDGICDSPRGETTATCPADCCLAGHAKETQAAMFCDKCPPGTFAPAGSPLPCGEQQCKGLEYDNDNDSTTQCQLCNNSLLVAPPIAGSCRMCPRGSTDADWNPLTACVPCPAGTAVPMDSRGACARCQAPKIDNDSDSSTPGTVPCDDGFGLFKDAVCLPWGAVVSENVESICHQLSGSAEQFAWQSSTAGLCFVCSRKTTMIKSCGILSNALNTFVVVSPPVSSRPVSMSASIMADDDSYYPPADDSHRRSAPASIAPTYDFGKSIQHTNTSGGSTPRAPRDPAAIRYGDSSEGRLPPVYDAGDSHTTHFTNAGVPAPGCPPAGVPLMATQLIGTNSALRQAPFLAVPAYSPSARGSCALNKTAGASVSGGGGSTAFVDTSSEQMSKTGTMFLSVKSVPSADKDQAGGSDRKSSEKTRSLRNENTQPAEYNTTAISRSVTGKAHELRIAA